MDTEAKQTNFRRKQLTITIPKTSSVIKKQTPEEQQADLEAVAALVNAISKAAQAKLTKESSTQQTPFNIPMVLKSRPPSVVGNINTEQKAQR